MHITTLKNLSPTPLSRGNTGLTLSSCPKKLRYHELYLYCTVHIALEVSCLLSKEKLPSLRKVESKVAQQNYEDMSETSLRFSLFLPRTYEHFETHSTTLKSLNQIFLLYLGPPPLPT
jgi:hypothetical protein